MAASPDRFIVLRPSMIVPVEPYLLLLRLEAQGFTFRVAPDGVPEAAPFDRLSSDDLALLKRWCHHIAMLITYVADDSHLVTDRPVMPVSARRTA